MLLITTRETRRWIVPKGNPIRGLKPHEAAAQEAYEEAGVTGITSPAPLGQFEYLKRKLDGSNRLASVTVYPLAVTDQADQWPEQDQREFAWFALDQAARAVEEPQLKRLIGNFHVNDNAASPPHHTGMFGWLKRLVGSAGRA